MINKDLAIKLMNYYGGITYKELLTLIPNNCLNVNQLKLISMATIKLKQFGNVLNVGI